MRPAVLNPLFVPVTSLSGVGPKQDKLLRYLLDRAETPRLVDLLLHMPASVIDRRSRPKLREAVPGSVVTLKVTVDRHRPQPNRNSRAPYLIYASDDTGDVVLTYFRGDRSYLEKLLPVGAERYVSGTIQTFDGMWQIVRFNGRSYLAGLSMTLLTLAGAVALAENLEAREELLARQTAQLDR